MRHVLTAFLLFLIAAPAAAEPVTSSTVRYHVAATIMRDGTVLSKPVITVLANHDAMMEIGRQYADGSSSGYTFTVKVDRPENEDSDKLNLAMSFSDGIGDDRETLISPRLTVLPDETATIEYGDESKGVWHIEVVVNPEMVVRDLPNG